MCSEPSTSTRKPKTHEAKNVHTKVMLDEPNHSDNQWTERYQKIDEITSILNYDPSSTSKKNVESEDFETEGITPYDLDEKGSHNSDSASHDDDIDIINKNIKYKKYKRIINQNTSSNNTKVCILLIHIMDFLFCGIFSLNNDKLAEYMLKNATSFLPAKQIFLHFST